MHKHKDLIIDGRTMHTIAATLLKFLVTHNLHPPRSRSEFLHQVFSTLFEVVVDNKAIEPIIYADEAKQYYDSYFQMLDAGGVQGRNKAGLALNLASEDKLMTKSGVVLDKTFLDQMEKDRLSVQKNTESDFYTPDNSDADTSPIVTDESIRQRRDEYTTKGQTSDEKLVEDFEEYEKEQNEELDQLGPERGETDE